MSIEGADMAVDSEQIVLMRFAKSLSPAPNEGEKSENLEEAKGNSTFVALLKEENSSDKQQEVESEQASQPRCNRREVADHKNNQGSGPQEEVAKDVKQRIERHRSQRALCAYEVRKFEHAIGSSARPEGSGVGKGEARHGELCSTCERNVTISVPRIDQKLKSIGVEGIDWNPAAHDEGKITDYAVKIVANDLPPIRETPDEKPDGEQSKGEEQIAIERFHARGCRGMREGGREGK